MAECLSKTDELGKEGLLRGRVHKPNLMRVAQELSKFSDPYKTTGILVLALKGGSQDGTNAK